MKIIRKIFTAVLMSAIVVTSAVPVLPQVQIDAYAMSRKSAQKQVKSLNKQIKKLRNSISVARAKDARDAADIKELHGYVYCPDPLIVSDASANSQYYFESSDGLSINDLYVRGYYRTVNQYINFNGNQVQLAVAVSMPHAEADTQAKLDASVAKKAELKKALDDSVIIEDITLSKDQSVPLTIHWKYGTQTYNTFKFKTKNSKIADISSNGVVTAKKKGTASYTATMSASGRKVTFKVKVI